MQKHERVAASLVAFASALLMLCACADAAEPVRITSSTAHSAIKLFVADDGRVYQLGYGATDANYDLPKKLNRLDEFYPPGGDGFIAEPALQAAHADGNTSTTLVYVKHDTQKVDDNVSLTRIELKDPAYPFHVTLNLRAYIAQDVIEQWAEIRHEEARPVRLDRYHSATPIFRAKQYFLTSSAATTNTKLASPRRSSRRD
jgi:alpha-galactosidase